MSKPSPTQSSPTQPATGSQKAAPPVASRHKTKAKKSQAAADSSGQEQGEAEPGGRSRSWIAATPSWLVSMVVHMIALLTLALIPLTVLDPAADKSITIAAIEEPVEEIEEIEPDEPEDINLDLIEDEQLETLQDQVDPTEETTQFDDPEMAAEKVELVENSPFSANENPLGIDDGAPIGDALSGRGAARRGDLVRKGGGSRGSENAVAAALKWLAQHQNKDGSWNFVIHKSSKQCDCKNQGTLDKCPLAATSMALLPFLGAGHTHKTGKHKKQVEAGVRYLVNHMHEYKGVRGSLFEVQGRGMYPHGLGSIVLCEAYAMAKKDKKLRGPAQASINFIVAAQDPNGGGWRYEPRQPGDTSVAGWQLMALKSGQMAYLKIPGNTLLGINKFLDSVQADQYGGEYGYLNKKDGKKRIACTPIALLCRMYLGWKKNHPGIIRGVEVLGKRGPTDNMYYNYYATQVMHHYGGESWKKWNGVMRDQLVDSQAKKGHEYGSWYKPKDHEFKGGKPWGGRLYYTALCAMTLEVYYRHLPIYKAHAMEEEFIID